MIQEEKVLYDDLYGQKINNNDTNENASTCSVFTSIMCFLCWICINCFFNLW